MHPDPRILIDPAHHKITPLRPDAVSDEASNREEDLNVKPAAREILLKRQQAPTHPSFLQCWPHHLSPSYHDQLVQHSRHVCLASVK